MKTLITGLLILLLVGFCLGFSTVSSADKPLQDSKALIKKVIDATNNRKPEIFKECYAPTFIYHDQSSPVGTPTDMVSIYNTSIAAAPDLKAAIEDMIVEKDKIAIRMIYEGTNIKYGRKFKIVNHWIARIDKGKIVEVWNVSDIQGMLSQLGFKTVPPDVNTM